MTAIELFRELRKGGYNKNWIGVDWKVVKRCLLFQASHGKLDWFFNIMSVLRIPWRLAGTWFIFPLGALIMWLSIQKKVAELAAAGEIDEIGGYSQGGWFTAYGSAKTLLPARTFGCPRLGKGSPSLFVDVTHYKNPGDIVTRVPTWANQYGNVLILNKQIQRPEGLTEIEWVSHHSPEEYEARLS